MFGFVIDIIDMSLLLHYYYKLWTLLSPQESFLVAIHCKSMHLLEKVADPFPQTRIDFAECPLAQIDAPATMLNGLQSFSYIAKKLIICCPPAAIPINDT